MVEQIGVTEQFLEDLDYKLEISESKLLNCEVHPDIQDVVENLILNFSKLEDGYVTLYLQFMHDNPYLQGVHINLLKYCHVICQPYKLVYGNFELIYSNESPAGGVVATINFKNGRCYDDPKTSLKEINYHYSFLKSLSK